SATSRHCVKIFPPVYFLFTGTVPNIAGLASPVLHRWKVFFCEPAAPIRAQRKPARSRDAAGARALSPPRRIKISQRENSPRKIPQEIPEEGVERRKAHSDESAARRPRC